MDNLTDYQRRYVDEYMRTGDRIKSIYYAGYKGKGNRSTVAALAHQLHNNEKIQQELERRRNDLARKGLVDPDLIVGRLVRMFEGTLTVKKKVGGKMVEQPIGFKEQIEAAKILVNIMGIKARMEQKDKKDTNVEKLADDIKKLTDAFLSRRVGSLEHKE